MKVARRSWAHGSHLLKRFFAGLLGRAGKQGEQALEAYLQQGMIPVEERVL